ncbi:MAG: hypothetical protein K9W45_01060 [Candidatus Heimdallarchaeum aukensis]|uniref:Uncharacterized protein n=1 Tax=Candidatus Heimdallarchaeum aukensis TaxID=2876573 RepID=A0A9Y1BL84_9ARCH|nr:MAG: hypothetical protein K9W45_01060 [Candidatus Heimdallarchaeum aukensis]
MTDNGYITGYDRKNREKFPIFFQILLSECFKENNNSLLILPENFMVNRFVEYLSLFLRTKNIQKTAFILSEQGEKIKFNNLLTEEKLPFISSTLNVERRKIKYQTSDIFFVTAKILRNDLLREVIEAHEIELAIFLHADKSKEENVYSNLVQILSSNSKIKFVGISKPIFKEKQELISVIEALMITNIFYKSSYSSIIQSCLYEKSNKKIVVPFTQELNQIKVNLRTLEGKVNSVLRKMGIKNPYYLRRNFNKEIQNLRDKNFNESTVEQIINLGIESIFLQSLIETLESSSVPLCLKLIENNLEKISHYSFSSSLFEIYTELKELKDEKHPKMVILVEEISKALNTPVNNSNKEKPTVLVYSSRRAVLHEIAEILIKKEIENFVILSTQMKKQLEELERFDKKEFQIVLASKNIPLNTDFTFLYSLPKQKTLFRELIQRPNSKCIITHRSIEEKIFYKWNERKNGQLIRELVSDKQVKEALLFNQQQFFNKKMMQMINPKTKALMTLNRFFEKNKKQKKDLEKRELKDNISESRALDFSLIRFLSGCSEEEALLLTEIINFSQINDYEKLTVNDLIPSFSENRAREIITKIKNRSKLISKF